MKVPVSFIIPVKNEEKNLPRCLASIGWADEIFVVDSHSSDATASIAKARGAEVVQFDFNGTWPKKKNWALENLPFAHEWVFILDADEVLPPDAGEEFRRIVSSTDGQVDGYWINRRFMFMGKWLRHAYYPNWNLRLFKHRAGRYEQLTSADTHSGDNEVHEHVIVQGRTASLACQMDHYAFPSIEVFIEKHNRYSNWEAHVALDTRLRESCRQPSENECRNVAEIEAMVAQTSLPAAVALPVRLPLAAWFPGWCRGILFCAPARDLRISLRGENARDHDGEKLS